MLGDLTYEYDKNGNRTKIGGSFARTGIPPAISSTAYNVANHQTTFDNKTLTYDNNGNLQTTTDPSGTTTYTWNARNQLVGISGPTVTASFIYDGLGRREKKTVNGNLTEFLYDGVNPVQETSGAAVLANILPGLRIDEFLTRTDVVAGTTSNFLTDTLGSRIAVTDAAGTVQTEYTYEPFGNTTTTGASNTNPYQYTGRENDSTGLYYYRARYYHPVLQRFTGEDPIEFYGGDVNLYAYVWNNPTGNVDPNGEFAQIAGGIVGGAIGGGIAGGIVGGVTGAITTGSLGGALQGAATGAVTGALAGAIAGGALASGLSPLALSGGQLAGGSVFGQGAMTGLIGGEKGALSGTVGAITGAIGSIFGPPVDPAYGNPVSGRKDKN